MKTEKTMLKIKKRPQSDTSFVTRCDWIVKEIWKQYEKAMKM